jgi:hypothetical protein
LKSVGASDLVLATELGQRLVGSRVGVLGEQKEPKLEQVTDHLKVRTKSKASVKATATE